MGQRVASTIGTPSRRILRRRGGQEEGTSPSPKAAMTSPSSSSMRLSRMAFRMRSPSPSDALTMATLRAGMVSMPFAWRARGARRGRSRPEGCRKTPNGVSGKARTPTLREFEMLTTSAGA